MRILIVEDDYLQAQWIYEKLKEGISDAARKFAKSVAAARSTGLRLLHFSNPESFRGCRPAGFQL